ncbi:MAG: AMP-binding protein [Gammaproteobacteria bacterium]|nr:AMP-binding protein [Gammaproteobacteria bacterium]MBI5618051.1 AMP-binding protein [Gammaproteobacteria bacterium]
MPDDANLYSEFRRHFPGSDAPLLTTPDGRTRTYGDAERESARLARALSDLGLVPGDRVSVQVEKSPAAIWLYFACLRAGFVFHPLNTAYTAAELAYFLDDAAPALVVHDPATAHGLAALCARLGIAHRLTLDETGQGTLSELVSSAAPDFEVVPRAPDELAALLYSSGTTGKPKGIEITHRNLAVNARALTAAWEFRRDDVLLHALPIFHVHGLFISLGCTLLSGSRLLFLPKFDVAAVLAALPEATVMMGVPTYYTRLLGASAFTAEAAAHLRLWTCGSAPLLPETFRAFEQRTGRTIVERYGMTETGVITSNPVRGARKAGAVGPPLPGVELRIVDDAGAPVGTGTIGHVQVRGPNVCRGYWRRPEKTAEDFTAERFFNTGDDGVLDGDGYLALVGRAKDLIITGGLNVYPKEIEEVLDAQPGVLESAVIGLPHADFGEEVVAVLVMKAGAACDETALRAAVKDCLAGYKRPKRYVLRPALPRNAMGKVQKNVLREELAAA